MDISISSTFVDPDAVNLVSGLHDAIRDGTIQGVNLDCIISTRAIGDNPQTDGLLKEVNDRVSVPVVCVSARQAGRLVRSPSNAVKDDYDRRVIEAIQAEVKRLPKVNVMLGDMVVHGSDFCERVPSLNLHPDLPLTMGGREGMYWDVIGKWVSERRDEIGGMMHLAVPTLDAGTAVAYFRLPAAGIVNEVNLGELWKGLPTDKTGLDALIKEQVHLKDHPTHPLFQELRRAEASFEPKLVHASVAMLGQDTICIADGQVLDADGRLIVNGLDLTRNVVGDLAVWPGGEGGGRRGYERI